MNFSVSLVLMFSCTVLGNLVGCTVRGWSNVAVLVIVGFFLTSCVSASFRSKFSIVCQSGLERVSGGFWGIMWICGAMGCVISG